MSLWLKIFAGVPWISKSDDKAPCGPNAGFGGKGG